MPDGAAALVPLKRERLDGVQAARGAAALLVVLYHCGRMLSLPQYVGRIPLGNVFEFGHAGVDFFFVLSGFIIMHVHRGDLGRPGRFGRYAWRRATRIVPMYWVVTAIVVLKPGCDDLDEAVLRTHVRNRLAAYKVPKKVVFAPTLPRNASGKILKRELRADLDRVS